MFHGDERPFPEPPLDGRRQQKEQSHSVTQRQADSFQEVRRRRRRANVSRTDAGRAAESRVGTNASQGDVKRRTLHEEYTTAALQTVQQDQCK